jgi:hypothetical protein
METRELYKQKYEAQLHEWGAKIVALKAHADKLTAEARIDAKPHIDTLHDKLEAVKAKLNEVAQATDDKLDDVKQGADHAWDDLKSSIAGAYDAITPDKPDKPRKAA